MAVLPVASLVNTGLGNWLRYVTDRIDIKARRSLRLFRDFDVLQTSWCENIIAQKGDIAGAALTCHDSTTSWHIVAYHGLS